MTVMEKGPAQRPAYLDGKTKLMLIDGRGCAAASGKTFESRNPATGELLAKVAEGDSGGHRPRRRRGAPRLHRPVEQVEAGRAAARAAQARRPGRAAHRGAGARSTRSTWARRSARTRDNRQRAVGMLRYYAGMATSMHGETIENSLPGEIFSYTLKEPVGVVGAIIPWNGPLTAAIWKIGPALATGCTVVLKPAEEAPLTPLRLGELCLEAGVPPGVVNVVPGFGETAGAALCCASATSTRSPSPARTSPARRSSRPRRATSSACRSNWAASRPTSCSPTPISTPRCPAPRWRCSPTPGQICSAGTRLFVEQKIYDEFVERVAELRARR